MALGIATFFQNFLKKFRAGIGFFPIPGAKNGEIFPTRLSNPAVGTRCGDFLPHLSRDSAGIRPDSGQRRHRRAKSPPAHCCTDGLLLILPATPVTASQIPLFSCFSPFRKRKRAHFDNNAKVCPDGRHLLFFASLQCSADPSVTKNLLFEKKHRLPLSFAFLPPNDPWPAAFLRAAKENSGLCLSLIKDTGQGPVF